MSPDDLSAQISEASVREYVTRFLEAPSAQNDTGALVSVLYQAWLKYPELVRSELLPKCIGAVLTDKPKIRLPYEWVEQYVFPQVANPVLQLFQILFIEGEYVSEWKASRLGSCADLCNLDRYALWSCSLADEGAAAFAQALSTDRVKVLDLQDNWISDEGTIALVQSGKLSRLTHLSLFRNHIMRDGMRAIFRSSAMPALQVLSVGYQNRISADDLCDEVIACEWLGKLNELRLEYSDLTDEHVRTIVSCASINGLGALYLRGNQLSERGARGTAAVSEFAHNKTSILTEFLTHSVGGSAGVSGGSGRVCG